MTEHPAGSPILDCGLEPIHSPGAIQPYGALLVALAGGLAVTHASANLAAILGRSAESVLGRPLEEAVGETIGRLLQGSGPRNGTALGQVYTMPGPGGRVLQLHAHRSGRHICVDIEPMSDPPWPGSAQEPPITALQAVLETFKQATGQLELCALAVSGLRALTGYDRVMAYRFSHDGHGEVIAETQVGGLDSYLGLHYPAGDIPPQARRLYLRQRVGMIADCRYQPVPLLCDPRLDDGTPLDLTGSALRSVSPVHRKYLANINTSASLTIALATGPELWGMLVCHHQTPRIAGPELRSVSDMVGQVVSMLLRTLGEAMAYAHRFERNAILLSLVDRLATREPLPAELAAAAADLLHLVNASGAVVRISGKLACLGRTPPAAQAARVLDLLRTAADGELFAVEDFGRRYPAFADCMPGNAGALLLPLAAGTDDAILWFRPELARTVTWGGNPAEHVSADPTTGELSPRASFAAWQETVSGSSAPWEAADLAIARELRSLVEAAVTLRIRGELAQLRHYDPLTGLPNRSLLQEQLQQAETAAEAGGGTADETEGKTAAKIGGGGTHPALVFLDLDRFKTVNDTLGHAAGDSLLIEVARRLTAAAGPDNMVARLGGDEFVVLCRGLDAAAVAALGEQIRRAIEAPFEIDGRTCHISASIGTAVAEGSGGIDLVRAADMAMYAAKKGGGNRGVSFAPSLFDEVAQQFELEHELRRALASGDQFTLLYQPLFALGADGRSLAGFEALVRWRHPRHGWLSPGLFIPLAEKSGLILPLGDWVLATAVAQARVFQRSYPSAALSMAVNVSVLQLPQPGFCSGLAGLLEAEDYAPGLLCLEVTETMLTDVAAAAVLAEIRRLGVLVAIDDFGIGQSSLSYLRRVPADVVKLDRSFLEDVEGDLDGVGFVAAVVALAHAVGKPVVFEGIETQSQLDIAAAAGADLVQGFFFAPPLSANAAAELVAQHRQLDPKLAPRRRPTKSAGDSV